MVLKSKEPLATTQVPHVSYQYLGIEHKQEKKSIV